MLRMLVAAFFFVAPVFAQDLQCKCTHLQGDEYLCKCTAVKSTASETAVATPASKTAPTPSAEASAPKPAAQAGTPTGNTTATGKEIFTGPRGGQYHYSSSGKKVYERSKK